MKRREVLATAGSALALAGCTGTGFTGADSPDTTTTTPEATTNETTTAAPDNPWGKLPITVGLNREVSSVQNANELIQQALQYWEENAQTYAGHEVKYSYEPNNDNPDILVNIVAQITGCPQHRGGTRTVGCAPLIESTPPETSEIQVLGDVDDNHTLSILKHEFGHTLGLNHDDEPQEIMSDDPALRIPDYERRQKIVEKYHDGIQLMNEASETSKAASEAYDEREFDDAKTLFSETASKAKDAADAFGEAETTAIGIDEQKVADICAEAREKALKYYQAKFQMKRACEDFANDDYDAGNEHVDKQKQYHEEMQSLQIRNSRIIIDELGL